MKKTAAILTLGAALLVPAAGHAQSATGTVNASATVLAYLNVTNSGDLNFGSIPAGSGATVTPGSAPGAGQSLGAVRVDHNSDVSVSATLPTGLALAGQPDLPVSFQCGWSSSASGALIGAAGACGSMPNRTGSGNGTTITTYLQVGGTITPAATTNRVPGTYTGLLSFTFTAVY